MYYCAPEICGVSATIQLDHVIVPSHNRDNSIRRLTNLLGLSCSPASAGTLFSVYINDGLTLDFIQTDEAFLVEHFCSPVDELELKKVLTRIEASNIPYRSSVQSPVGYKINTDYGAKMLYWNEPDGRQWETLTASYARQKK